MNRTRINLVNPDELLEIPGIGLAQADAILRHRAQHGPIENATQLEKVLGGAILPPAVLEHVDFAPADGTAPEAPGA
jgi:DNA uptake protein ComE-like DNA-binding protein